MVDSIYPAAWPTCSVCGDPAMDGHITCGGVACNEREQRALVHHGIITVQDVDAILAALQKREEAQHD